MYNNIIKHRLHVWQKDQYYFPGNAGVMVKITKWTGQDHVAGIHVSPQNVALEVVLQKVPSEANPKGRNHGEGPY